MRPEAGDVAIVRLAGGIARSQNQRGVADMTDHPLSIQAFQKHIRARYYETDRTRGTAATFMWLIEEVGELATALHGDDKTNLEDEFADVVAWLCTLANINDVDLAEALRKKYLTGEGPRGHK
jgi:NTP pyrophosphatase (non-canonical NTP hydrolase)